MWKQHVPKPLWYLAKKNPKILPNAVQQTWFGNEGVSGVSAEGNSWVM